MLAYQRLTSEELILICRNSKNTNELESVLADRLANALDEVDTISKEMEALRGADPGSTS
jgi:hypothetical protein